MLVNLKQTNPSSQKTTIPLADDSIQVLRRK